MLPSEEVIRWVEHTPTPPAFDDFWDKYARQQELLVERCPK